MNARLRRVIFTLFIFISTDLYACKWFVSNPGGNGAGRIPRQSGIENKWGFDAVFLDSFLMAVRGSGVQTGGRGGCICTVFAWCNGIGLV